MSLWLDIFISAGILGNCSVCLMLFTKLKIPSSFYVIERAVLDTLALVVLYVCVSMQNLTFDVLHILVLMSSVHSSLCNLVSLMTELSTLELQAKKIFCQSRFGEIRGKLVPAFFAVCAIFPCAFILKSLLNLELENIWKMQVYLLEIILLFLLPQAGIVFLSIEIKRLLNNKTTFVPGREINIHTHERYKQFTDFVICNAMVACVTYPVFASTLALHFVFPDGQENPFVLLTVFSIVVQCGASFFVYLCLELKYKIYGI